jgi:TPR repeat protein
LAYVQAEKLKAKTNLYMGFTNSPATSKSWWLSKKLRGGIFMVDSVKIILGFIAIATIYAIISFAGTVGTVAQYSVAYDIVNGKTDTGYTAKGINWVKELFASDNKQSVTPQAILNPNKNKYGSLQDLKAAAEHGDVDASYILGTAYMNGTSVPKDTNEALKWYDVAADGGNSDAETQLGELACPQQILNTSCEPHKAYAYFYLGAINGNSYAKNKLEIIKNISSPAQIAAAEAAIGASYYWGKGVRQNYTEAEKWYRMAAEKGNARAQSDLGNMYRDSRGVPEDKAEALFWFTKSASQGFASAQNSIGSMYSKGQVVPQDYKEAIKWYQKAADQGLAVAQTNLGAAYSLGHGVLANEAEAMKWYTKAAQQGYAPAQVGLSLAYSSGKGGIRDNVEAIKLLRLSAAQGEAMAQYLLGIYYSNGLYVPKDNVLAYMWLNLSTAQEYEEAKSSLLLIEKTMTVEQIAEAQRLSREWKPQLSEIAQQQ